MVAVLGQVAQTPGDALAARLDDPQTAESLNQILDHVDLLAVVVTGLSGLVSRGDTITDSLSDGMREFAGLEQSFDVAGLLAAAKQFSDAAPKLLEMLPKLLEMLPKLLEMLPMLERLLSSDIVDPQVIDLGSAVARAAVTGAQQSQGASVRGVRALLRVLKDDDVSRAMGFVFSVAKALGQQLPTAPAGNPKHSNQS